MIMGRLLCSLSAACALASVIVAPPAGAAATSAPVVKAIVCNQVVALGSTTPCDLPAGGTARYRFTVPSADTVRFRAAVPDSNPGRTLTLSKSDGTEICAKESFPQFGCYVASGGAYRLDVTLTEAATVYTTIDTALSATCGPPLDVSVGNPGSTVHIADPGASWCAGLDVAAGEGLEMVLDVNTDQGLTVQVYDDAGVLICQDAQVSAFVRSGCGLTGGGDGYRLFATPYDDTAQDMLLIVTQLSHPIGCGTPPFDPFGVPTSRRGTLGPHQQRCYRFSGVAGQGIGAHLFAVSGPTGTLFWQLRDDAGVEVCSGGPASSSERLRVCTLPADGEYNLFVSMLARSNVRYALSLVDLSSAAGCASVSSTKWNTHGDSGSLSGLGEIDCLTFNGNSGDIVRASDYGDANATAGVIVNAAGARVCEVVFRATCTLPATGTYRVAVSAYLPTPVGYRLWVIDMSSTAGCRATTTDTFGVAPDRRAGFRGNVAVCFSFDVQAGAAYYFRTAPVTHQKSTVGQIRSVDGSYVCTDASCTVPTSGSYLYVVTNSSSSDVPTDLGRASAGLWRIDQPTGCTTIGTSFAGAPTAGSLAVGEVDCHEFAGSPGDQVLVRTAPADYEVTNRIFDRSGAPVCFAFSNTCTLTGSGPYRLLTYASGGGSLDYDIKLASLTAGAGCTNLPVTPFGRAPNRSFDLPDPVELRCYRITMPDYGQIGVRMVNVTGTPDHPSVHLYGHGVSGFCAVSSEFGSCEAHGPGDYLLVLSGDEPASGTVGWLDLASTAGCTSGPDLAFGSAATRKRISARGAVVCMTLPLAARDRARFAFGPSEAGANLRALLLSRAGVTTCDFASSYQSAAYCSVPRSEAGPVRLVVYADEDSSTFTGVVRMHAWRLNHPMGCIDIGSLRDGFGPLVGKLADKNDEACYLAQARAGTLAVTTSNDDVVDEAPILEFFRSDVGFSCGVVGSGSCSVGDGTYTMLVRRSPQDVDFSGRYRVQGTCTAGKCGP